MMNMCCKTAKVPREVSSATSAPLHPLGEKPTRAATWIFMCQTIFKCQTQNATATRLKNGKKPCTAAPTVKKMLPFSNYSSPPLRLRHLLPPPDKNRKKTNNNDPSVTPIAEELP